MSDEPLTESVTVYGPALRDLLVRVDSVCSLVAHRGIDNEARAELVAVSRIARSMYEHPEKWRSPRA